MKSIKLLFTTLLLGACSDSQRILPATQVAQSGAQRCIETGHRDTVVAASFNMSIGFKVEDLLFLDLSNDSIVMARTRQIFAQSDSALPRERVRRAAQEIVLRQPDVVGLQETMRLERDGVVLMDMLDTLQSDLDALQPGRWKLVRAPLNRADLAPHWKDLPTLRAGFQEGLAILFSSRWSLVQTAVHRYRNTISLDIAGRRSESERAVQGAVLRTTNGFELEVWNTHLEVLSGPRQAQAGELLLVTDSVRAKRQAAGSPPSGRLLLGDLNSDPKVEADSMIASRGWKDIWIDAGKTTLGATCCVGNLRDSTTHFRETGRRIDRVMHQGGCRVDSAEVFLDRAFLTSSGQTLFAGDHGMVFGKVIYGVGR